MKSIREIQCKRIMEQTSKKTVTKLRKVNVKSDVGHYDKIYTFSLTLPFFLIERKNRE